MIKLSGPSRKGDSYDGTNLWMREADRCPIDMYVPWSFPHFPIFQSSYPPVRNICVYSGTRSNL